MFLEWDPPPADLQYGTITGYVIDYLEDGVRSTVSVAAHVRQYTLEATPHTEYVLGVAALNSAGIGPLSPTMELHTQEECTFFSISHSLNSYTLDNGSSKSCTSWPNGGTPEFQINFLDVETTTGR